MAAAGFPELDPLRKRRLKGGCGQDCPPHGWELGGIGVVPADLLPSRSSPGGAKILERSLE